MRSPKSAKAAGSSFEKLIADVLAEHLDDRIERRTKNGSKDRGDVSGLRFMGQRVVVECKNVSSGLSLSEWAKEAETERLNDDAGVWLIAHKRFGKGDPLDQWVSLTMRELVSLLTGVRP